MKHIDNIRRIRAALGTGPVKEEREEPGPVAKKGRKVGAREAQARSLREAQSLNHRQP